MINVTEYCNQEAMESLQNWGIQYKVWKIESSKITKVVQNVKEILSKFVILPKDQMQEMVSKIDDLIVISKTSMEEIMQVRYSLQKGINEINEYVQKYIKFKDESSFNDKQAINDDEIHQILKQCLKQKEMFSDVYLDTDFNRSMLTQLHSRLECLKMNISEIFRKSSAKKTNINDIDPIKSDKIIDESEAIFIQMKNNGNRKVEKKSLSKEEVAKRKKTKIEFKHDSIDACLTIKDDSRSIERYSDQTKLSLPKSTGKETASQNNVSIKHWDRGIKITSWSSDTKISDRNFYDSKQIKGDENVSRRRYESYNKNLNRFQKMLPEKGKTKTTSSKENINQNNDFRNITKQKAKSISTEDVNSIQQKQQIKNQKVMYEYVTKAGKIVKRQKCSKIEFDKKYQKFKDKVKNMDTKVRKVIDLEDDNDMVNIDKGPIRCQIKGKLKYGGEVVDSEKSKDLQKMALDKPGEILFERLNEKKVKMYRKSDNFQSSNNHAIEYRSLDNDVDGELYLFDNNLVTENLNATLELENQTFINAEKQATTAQNAEILKFEQSNLVIVNKKEKLMKEAVIPETNITSPHCLINNIESSKVPFYCKKGIRPMKYNGNMNGEFDDGIFLDLNAKASLKVELSNINSDWIKEFSMTLDNKIKDVNSKKNDVVKDCAINGNKIKNGKKDFCQQNKSTKMIKNGDIKTQSAYLRDNQIDHNPKFKLSDTARTRNGNVSGKSKPEINKNDIGKVKNKKTVNLKRTTTKEVKNPDIKIGEIKKDDKTKHLKEEQMKTMKPNNVGSLKRPKAEKSGKGIIANTKVVNKIEEIEKKEFVEKKCIISDNVENVNFVGKNCGDEEIEKDEMKLIKKEDLDVCQNNGDNSQKIVKGVNDCRLQSNTEIDGINKKGLVALEKDKNLLKKAMEFEDSLVRIKEENLNFKTEYGSGLSMTNLSTTHNCWEETVKAGSGDFKTLDRTLENVGLNRGMEINSSKDNEMVIQDLEEAETLEEGNKGDSSAKLEKKNSASLEGNTITNHKLINKLDDEKGNSNEEIKTVVKSVLKRSGSFQNSEMPNIKRNILIEKRCVNVSAEGNVIKEDNIKVIDDDGQSGDLTKIDILVKENNCHSKSTLKQSNLSEKNNRNLPSRRNTSYIQKNKDGIIDIKVDGKIIKDPQKVHDEKGVNTKVIKERKFGFTGNISKRLDSLSRPKGIFRPKKEQLKVASVGKILSLNLDVNSETTKGKLTMEEIQRKVREEKRDERVNPTQDIIFLNDEDLINKGNEEFREEFSSNNIPKMEPNTEVNIQAGMEDQGDIVINEFTDTIWNTENAADGDTNKIKGESLREGDIESKLGKDNENYQVIDIFNPSKEFSSLSSIESADLLKEVKRKHENWLKSLEDEKNLLKETDRQGKKIYCVKPFFLTDEMIKTQSTLSLNDQQALENSINRIEHLKYLEEERRKFKTICVNRVRRKKELRIINQAVYVQKQSKDNKGKYLNNLVSLSDQKNDDENFDGNDFSLKHIRKSRLREKAMSHFGIIDCLSTFRGNLFKFIHKNNSNKSFSKDSEISFSENSNSFSLKDNSKMPKKKLDESKIKSEEIQKAIVTNAKETTHASGCCGGTDVKKTVTTDAAKRRPSDKLLDETLEDDKDSIVGSDLGSYQNQIDSEISDDVNLDSIIQHESIVKKIKVDEINYDEPIKNVEKKKTKMEKPKFNYYDDDFNIKKDLTDNNEAGGTLIKDKSLDSETEDTYPQNLTDEDFPINKEDLNNPKYWPTYVYRIKQENSTRSVIACILKAKVGGIGKQLNLECRAISPERSLPHIDLREDVASNAFELKQSDEAFKFNFETLWKLSIPHLVPKSSQKDLVILTLNEEGTSWIELPTYESVSDEYKEFKLRLMETKLDSPTGIFLMQTKTKVEGGVITKHGARIISSIDSRVFISVPADAIRITLNTSLKINSIDNNFWKELKSKSDKTALDQVICSSHLIDFVSKKKKLIKPANISCFLPMNPEIKKQIEAQTNMATQVKKTFTPDDDDAVSTESNSSVSTVKIDLNPFQKSLMMTGITGANANENIQVVCNSAEEDKWFPMENVQLSVDKTKEQISMELPIAQSLRFVMVRTNRNITTENISKSVRMIEHEFSVRNSQIILMKSTTNLCEFVLIISLKSKVDRVVSQMTDDGFQMEPQNSPISVELFERQHVSAHFTGNVVNKKIERNILKFTYQSLFQINYKFQVKELDSYAQRAIDHYRGYLHMYIRKLVKKPIEVVDPKLKKGPTQYHWVEEDVIVGKLLISLPKKKLVNFRHFRDTVFNRKLLDEYITIFATIAEALRGSWKELGLSLQISESRMQSIRHHNNANHFERMLVQMLIFWLKGLAMEENKLDILIKALLEIKRSDLAMLIKKSMEEEGSYTDSGF